MTRSHCRTTWSNRTQFCTWCFVFELVFRPKHPLTWFFYFFLEGESQTFWFVSVCWIFLSEWSCRFESSRFTSLALSIWTLEMRNLKAANMDRTRKYNRKYWLPWNTNHSIWKEYLYGMDPRALSDFHLELFLSIPFCSFAFRDPHPIRWRMTNNGA
jgi:hypothetical protein